MFILHLLYLSDKSLFEALVGIGPDLGEAANGKDPVQDRHQNLVDHFNKFVMWETVIGSTHIHLATGTKKQSNCIFVCSFLNYLPIE